MAIFDENDIQNLFHKNLKQAKRTLGKLKFCSNLEPEFRGLTGWVFEQTVQDCLRRELDELGIKINIEEQASLGGRVKADLLVGPIALEIKARGFFDASSANVYRKYRRLAKRKRQGREFCQMQCFPQLFPIALGYCHF